MNNVVLDNALLSLLNSGIIKKDKRLFYLNFGNERTKLVIELVARQHKEMRELPLNVYFAIIEIINLLSRFKFIDVYLFGSYAKLIFNEKSDIDIAIVSNSEEKVRKNINALIEKLEPRYNVKIEIHYFSSNFYKNKQDSLVKDILKNGIKLI